MTDTFWVGQVDSCDLIACEEDAKLAVLGFGSNGEAFASEGFRDFPQPALEGDVVLGAGNGAKDLLVAVLDGRQALGHRARTGPVAAGGNFQAERLVRPF